MSNFNTFQNKHGDKKIVHLGKINTAEHINVMQMMLKTLNESFLKKEIVVAP